MSKPLPPSGNTPIHIGGYRHMTPHRIIRLQADRNYTRVYDTNGQFYMVSITLKIIEERLQPYGFLRVTRGDVINTQYIRKLGSKGKIQLTNGTCIVLSRRRHGVLRHVLPDLIPALTN